MSTDGTGGPTRLPEKRHSPRSTDIPCPGIHRSGKPRHSGLPSPASFYRTVPVPNIPGASHSSEWSRLSESLRQDPVRVSSPFHLQPSPECQDRPRNEQISARRNDPRYVPQASFRGRRNHMAKEIVCHHHLLLPQDMAYLQIAGISLHPDDPFPDPGCNFYLVPFPIEHVPHFLSRHALENM